MVAPRTRRQGAAGLRPRMHAASPPAEIRPLVEVMRVACWITVAAELQSPATARHGVAAASLAHCWQRSARLLQRQGPPAASPVGRGGVAELLPRQLLRPPPHHHAILFSAAASPVLRPPPRGGPFGFLPHVAARPLPHGGRLRSRGAPRRPALSSTLRKPCSIVLFGGSMRWTKDVRHRRDHTPA